MVQQFPDYPGGLLTLTEWLFPGPSYRDVMRFIQDTVQARNYLEIGVEEGGTLSLAGGADRAVGIDPKPRLATQAPANARVFQTTRDDFFAQQTRDGIFDGKAIDLAFVDGMHWFDFALRDFANTEA